MAYKHYGIAVIPDAHQVAINYYIAMIENEPLEDNKNLSRQCNPGGVWGAPITHWLGGQFYSDEKLYRYQTARFREEGDVITSPAGGWPLIYNEQEILTEQQALDAIDAFVLVVTSGEEFPQMSTVTLAAAEQALGIALVEEPIC